MKAGEKQIQQEFRNLLGKNRSDIIRLLAIPAAVTVVMAIVLYYLLSTYLIKEAEENLRNVLLSHRGVHHYIQRVMHPTFYKARDDGKIVKDYYAPEIFSSSFMVRVLHGFYNEEREKAGLPKIYYKIAADNPRNPVNRADEFESGLIRMFNEKKDVREYRSIVNFEGKKHLYYAIPFLETNDKCIKCHGNREDAPEGLQARYPGQGGFGEKAGRIRAIESIRVPIEQKLHTVYILTGSLSAGVIAMILFVMFNMRLRMLVRTKTSALETEIAEHEKAQDSLILFKNLLDRSNDAIFVIDPETGSFVDVNDKACSSLGYTREELLNMRTSDIAAIVPDDSSWKAHVAEVKDRGYLIFEERHKRKDGTLLPVEVNVKYIEVEKGSYMLAVARDLTERTRLEEQLFQAQKMEAVGQLAGGIAHDFNNMLTAIIGYGSLLNMRLEADSQLKPFAEEILNSAEKSASLTRQLLAFSRKQIIRPRQTDLNELIRGIEKLLKRLIGEDIDFKSALADEQLSVMVDAGQIDQVLMNLCTNARDAMPYGGLLSISTDSVELDREYAKAHAIEKAGRYALMAVTDTGIGMDEKSRLRIFEPFFTTKEVGKGTGLGLSIVYGIVKQHNGHINIYSEPGKGTTFRIYLPLIEPSAAEAKTEKAAIPCGGTETIMIAEDNEEVRLLTKRVLEEFGYKIIEAVDGEDAVKRFIENKDCIQLTILDVIMPKKNGKETWEEIRKIRPDARVLFTSGYTADVIHQKGILEEDLEFISKPVTPHDLLLKVRELLDK